MPQTSLSSTVIPRESSTVETQTLNSANSLNEGFPLAQAVPNSEEIQTSESFRMSSQFNALASQPTPPCARGVPVNVQFQTPSEQYLAYSQLHKFIFSCRSKSPFRTQEVPHSTRAVTTTVPSTNTQPTTRRPQNIPNNIPTNYNTIRMMPSESDALHSSSHLNYTNRTVSDSYIRQAGSELQALKRWLGAKTFEGEIVDTKHFSIDEFISSLKLCVESGICSEQTIQMVDDHTRSNSFFPSLGSEPQSTFRHVRWQRRRSAIYGRRQQKNESLPDFVDSMQQLMGQLLNKFNDQQRISTIISCALPDEARMLRSRYYIDIADFTRHVAFLSQDRPRQTNERLDKRPHREKYVFSCEVAGEEIASSSEGEEENTSLDIQAITAAFQKSLTGLKFKRPSKPTEGRKSKPTFDNSTKNKEQSAQSETNGQKSKFYCHGCYANCKNCQSKQMNENKQPKRNVYCFGCGAANVYFSNCTDCQAKLSKNASPASATATSQAPAN